MRYDIILCGVGGQGVLSMASIIGRAAATEGLEVKQSEVHGMSQRGGAVVAHLRLSDQPIASDLIPQGTADLILSMEPVESLRYVAYLAPGGSLVTAVNAVVNIPDYPEMDGLLARVRALPRSITVDAERLAFEAGDVLAVNTVMVGTASRLLPLRVESLEQAVQATFRAKGERVASVNLAAFRRAREATA
jgi:indolepyruvate ferredoxin oxidoreductase, beta subunit